MIVFLSIDSAKMKRKQTSSTPFLAKKFCQGKAILCLLANISTYSVTSTSIPGTSRSNVTVPSQSNSELMSGQVMEMKV